MDCTPPVAAGGRPNQPRFAPYVLLRSPIGQAVPVVWPGPTIYRTPPPLDPTGPLGSREHQVTGKVITD